MFKFNKSWVLTTIVCLGFALMMGCSPGFDESDNIDPSIKTGDGESGFEDSGLTEELAKFEDLDTWSADVFSTSSEGDIEQKIAVQGKNMRIETIGSDTEIASITIVNADEDVMYIYDPKENTAYEISMSHENSEMEIYEEDADYEEYLGEGDWVDEYMDDYVEEEIDPSTFANEFWGDNIEHIGTEKIDGKKCNIYAFSDEYMDGQVWIWEKHGFPLKWEGVDEEGDKMSVEYRNVVIGEVPAEKFRLPDGVEILDFGF